MSMKESIIKAGHAYTSRRWRGDRKVTEVVKVEGRAVVYYADLRTGRTGKSPLSRFAASADGPGLVANA